MCECNRNYQKVDHILFDLDGLLLDTEVFYLQAAVEACASFGVEFPQEYHDNIKGLSGLDNARFVVSTMNLPVSPEDYYALTREKIVKLFPSSKLLPGTEEIYVELYKVICGRYGKEYTFELREKVMGTIEKDTCAIIARELNLPVTPEELLDQQHALQEEMLTQVPLMPGAERLVRHFHKHNIPIAVATSSSKESVDLKLTNHKELFTLFHHIVCASTDPEVKRGKPSPDIFLVCASRFPDKPPAEKCLVFEDAPNGVKAAVAAGMQVVMVPDPQVAAEHKKQATLVLRSLEEFKPELFGLPPF
ncbi:Pseudouridine-5'-phosphatase [Blattella germanica]|nr:Pseudouridine-5'-phosphatase [Blattella germanica]